MFPEVSPRLRRGKQNSLFPARPVIKCFVIPPNSKLEKNATKSFASLTLLTTLPQFQEARPDHVRVQSSCCCFSGELVSSVHPRELVSFDTRHVTRSPPIAKRS